MAEKAALGRPFRLIQAPREPLLRLPHRERRLGDAFQALQHEGASSTRCGPSQASTGLYHSLRECQLPPSPPPPMVTAEMPSDIGWLESVEEPASVTFWPGATATTDFCAA